MGESVTQCPAACPGFSPDPQTRNAARSLTAVLSTPSREGLFEKISELILRASAEELMTYASLLAQAIPELAPTVGFDQRSPHHVYPLFTHIAHVTGAVPAELPLRWAALLHDVGKVPCFTRDATGRGHFYGHAQVGAEMADGILRRLNAPASLRETAVLLIRLHMIKVEPELEDLRRRFSSEVLLQLLHLQEADMCGKGMGRPPEAEQFPRLRKRIEASKPEPV